MANLQRLLTFTRLSNNSLSNSLIRGCIRTQVFRNIPAFQSFRRLIKTSGIDNKKSDKTEKSVEVPAPDGGRSLTEARLRHEGHKDPAAGVNPYDHVDAHPEYLPPNPHTSGGLGDVYQVHPEFRLKKTKPPVTAEDFANHDYEKNWVSYGWNHLHKDEDRFLTHFFCFAIITFLFGGSGIIIWYYPDVKYHDWAMREAYLEMHRRKKEGTEYVSRYLVDPAKITLPTEEELEGFEIII